jgi:hypothetical protein
MQGGRINQKTMRKATWAYVRKISHCRRKLFSTCQALFAFICFYFQLFSRVLCEVPNLGRLMARPFFDRQSAAQNGSTCKRTQIRSVKLEFTTCRGGPQIKSWKAI